MKPHTADEKWWIQFPPSTVFNALNLLSDHDAQAEAIERARRERYEQLTVLIDWLERIPALTRDDILRPPKADQVVPPTEIKRFVVLYAAVLSALRSGYLRDELEAWAPRLLTKFDAIREQAFTRVKSRRAVLLAQLEHAAGEAAGESLRKRLTRSIKNAAAHEPIDLGSFAEFADVDS